MEPKFGTLCCTQQVILRILSHHENCCIGYAFTVLIVTYVAMYTNVYMYLLAMLYVILVIQIMCVSISVMSKGTAEEQHFYIYWQSSFQQKRIQFHSTCVDTGTSWSNNICV